MELVADCLRSNWRSQVSYPRKPVRWTDHKDNYDQNDVKFRVKQTNKQTFIQTNQSTNQLTNEKAYFILVTSIKLCLNSVITYHICNFNHVKLLLNYN